MRILIPARSFNRLREQLSSIVPKAEFVLLDQEGLSLNGQAVDAKKADIEVAWVSLDSFRGTLIRKMMVAVLKASGIKWMQFSGAGYDHPVFAKYAKRPMRISTSASQAPAIAEYVIANAFYWLQRFDLRATRQSEKRWKPQMFREMTGSRWMIVGMGNIGQEIASRVKALGGHITAVRRTDNEHPLADQALSFTRIAEAAPHCDVVCFACPLTPDTRQIGNAALFSAMKDNAIFINIGRGGLVDEKALLTGLDQGKPQFAVLDVFEKEPLPAENPFWSHPNVLVTPHDSNAGLDVAARGDQLFLDNLKRYLAGERLINEQDNETILASHR